ISVYYDTAAEEPQLPRIIGSVDTPGRAWGVFISGNYAFVADGGAGLQIIDISNSASPVIVGSVDTPCSALDVYISENHAFVADNWRGGLQIIDVSNPRSPIIIGSVDTPDWAWGVFISGNHAFVADWERGLQIIDISNLSSPVIVGSVDTPGHAEGVFISKNYAFVADGWKGGLQIIDISNLSSPVIVGSVDTPGFARDVFISENHAFVADGGNGLQIIDISNPRSPVIVGSVDTPGWVIGVFISGNHAFVADGEKGLQIIDVSNPRSPVIIGSVDTPGSAWGVYISGDHAFVADHRDGGLQIIDISAVVGVPVDPPVGDTLSPILTITSPADNARLTTASVTVSGTATDAGQGDSGISKVKVNGFLATDGTATGSGTANWHKTISLSPGANTITVVAFDDSPRQNSTPQTITVYYEPLFQVSARIDDYEVHPREVTVGDEVTLDLTFTNTSDREHTFGVKAVLRSPDGRRITFLESVTVAPGRWGSARWTATIDRPGRWDVVFGVWEQATHPLRDLLDQTGWVAEYITATEDPTPLPAPRFLTLPFRDVDIKIQQGWIYTWDPDPGAHKGIDYIKGEVDQLPWQSFDVVAAADGRAIRGSSPSWGTYVYIHHYERAICGNNYHTLYAHLESVDPKISDTEWTPVRRGEFIGRAGATGVKDRYGNPQPAWVHLHFELHIGDARPREKAYNRIDPYDLYKTREYYPGGQKYTRSGQNHLWTSDPPTQAPAAHPVITSPLEITPLKEFYQAKEDLTAQFTISNKGTDPITFNVLVVGGRGPAGEIVDFGKAHNITLNPGDSYNYQGSLTLPDRLGEYYFFIAYQTPDGKWHSNIDVKIDGEIVEGAEAINFRVRHILVDAIIKAPPPPALWHEIGGPWEGEGRSLSQVAVYPNNPEVIYVVVELCRWPRINEYRLYKSTTGGKSWNPIGERLPYLPLRSRSPREIYAIAIAPSNPNIIYIASSVFCRRFGEIREVIRSINGGEDWTVAVSGHRGACPWEGVKISLLVVHPTNPDIVYAATSGGEIWRTEDAGKSWERVWQKGVPFVTYYEISALTISPIYPYVIYAAAYQTASVVGIIAEILAAWKKGGFAISLPQGILIKSEKGGDKGTWQELCLGYSLTPKIDDIAISRKNPNIVYVVTAALNVHWTSDGGKIWHSAGEPVDTLLPKQPSLLGRDVSGHSITLHPFADAYGPIYIGIAGGKYLTGERWDPWNPAGGVYVVFDAVFGDWYATERKEPTAELVFASDADSLILYAAGPDGLWAIDLTKGEMVIRPLSPGELRVYDSQGRVTGLVDGVVKQEIPHSVYDAENKTVTILSPIDTYRFVVAGIEEGEFGLMIALADDRKVAPFSVADIPTSAYTTHQFTIDWDLLAQEDRGATVEIDADGDGVFEEKIELQLPRPSFIYSPVSPTVGQTITFDASYSYDPDGNITSYRWDFGDGVTEVGKTTSHSFPWAGNYRVTLSVTDNDGVVRTSSKVVTVAAHAPVPVDPTPVPVDPTPG
ncbi:PKD domain-containing protein, partial [Thermodesulfovibrionales bacterium]|nr:PKD domain-containing protein [Thermodesulfovibrionales bacterium]